jgi:sec-independent protein translocase protein TatA
MRNPEIWIILIVVGFLVFGAKRMPDAARGLGRSLRIFKAETKGLLTDDDHPPVPANAPAQPLQIPATAPVYPPVAAPAPVQTAQPVPAAAPAPAPAAAPAPVAAPAEYPVAEHHDAP